MAGKDQRGMRLGAFGAASGSSLDAASPHFAAGRPSAGGFMRRSKRARFRTDEFLCPNRFHGAARIALIDIPQLDRNPKFASNRGIFNQFRRIFGQLFNWLFRLPTEIRPLRIFDRFIQLRKFPG